MKTISFIFIFAIIAGAIWADHAVAPRPAASGPTPDAPATVGTRFKYVDVFLDAGDAPVAAYQFELLMNPNAASVVSIEGGEHPAFNAAPYHDQLQLIQNRVIIAAFSTSNELPHGKTRVARVHVEIKPGMNSHFEAKLITAGSSDAKKIAADISIVEGEAK